jgi:folate-binding protein YgfZ
VRVTERELFWCADPRTVVVADGPDTLTYLQSQLSQDLRPLPVGGSTYSLALEPAGKAVALLRVWRTGDEQYVLDTDPVAGDALLARLNRFKIRVKTDFQPVEWACIAVRGAGAMEAFPGAISAWRGDGTAVDLLGPDVTVPDGVRAGTPEELLAARIAVAWPAAGVDYEPGGIIPAALGVSAEAVSFTKGCYPGQELVERMDSRGAQAPRVLRHVSVPAGTSRGDAVTIDGGADAVVTSVLGTEAIALVART